jgi:hypothetical protein
VWADADPTAISAVGVEIELRPDPMGGLNGALHGAYHGDPLPLAFAGFAQMMRARPSDHPAAIGLMDTNRDGAITFDEFAAFFPSGTVLGNVLSPDIELFTDGNWQPQPENTVRDSWSFAIGIHLTPCAEGQCRSPIPSPACDDRVLDGDETDVDCGGSCAACPPGASCKAAKDCQAPGCTDGKCIAPTCTDGVRDGFESDVDCGDNCPACALGKGCYTDLDCSAGKCMMDTSARGTCQ